MFRKLDDFLRAYAYQTESTKKILACLTDENLGQAVLDGHRTLGRIAWHITTSTAEMLNRTGLGVSAVGGDDPLPVAAEEIRTQYERVTTEAVEKIRASWSDETLAETDDMYGDQWPRGMTLAILIHHEIHHRGQMTVLLRQAGAKVPGVFGPSLEEWADYGADAPAV
ncbi:MAG: hypothetical protein GF346_01475 [Candidatus Eisenbacteria bacterium]|nr:hypothetical protein [Candidatus Latescibacterota bacterium]MBD3301100.1 hypothetical protein [Candidatus Eisenbacteria bacterium]